MNLTNDVLAELSALVITNNCASIVKQLDRKLYLKVNEALAALGSSWDRKAKAHVFSDDPTERLDAAIIAGEVTTAKDLGFFPTPASLARQLVEMAGVKPGDIVLEPSAGDGAIVKAIAEREAQCIAIEFDPKRRTDLALLVANTSLHQTTHVLDAIDFMAYEPEEPFDAIVMNPPFMRVPAGSGDHILHVVHAWKMLAPGGTLVSVMPAGIEFREDARHKQFREWALRHGTITPLPEDSFKESGTRVRTCVVKVTSK